MAFFAWCSRRSGGLAMIALCTLCYWVISKEAAASQDDYDDQKDHGFESRPYHPDGAGTWAVVFAYYCLLIHVLVFLFPLRACWAIWDLTKSLEKMARGKDFAAFKFSTVRRGSSTTLSSSESLATFRDVCSSSSSDAGDIELDLCKDASLEPRQVIHAIIIPSYKEDIDTLRETLEVLGSHTQARETYDVYLGMEQRESGVEMKASSLVSEFDQKFRRIEFTLHPSDIPGESPGKGSNVAWAARKLSEKYPMATRRDVIITSIDADSHLSSNYFTLVSSMHLSYDETATETLYSAPIIFDRNAHNVPAIVRVADILWCAAGLSGLYQGSTIAPPTSVYSLPLVLVDRVGGWDCDSEAIGEDLHMYLKCFFALNGNLTTRTILSPVSQSNVIAEGKGSGIRGIARDMRARYRQALRHMWGALDTGFALRQAFKLWQERKHTLRAFRPLHSSPNSGGVYIPENQIDRLYPEQAPESGIFSDVTQDILKEPNYKRIFYLFHRLFEAHFLPVHMTILVIASAFYAWVTQGAGDLYHMQWIFNTCNILRTIGFMQVTFYLYLYEKFHKTCVTTREKEMIEAGLATDMNFSHREIKKNLIDYVMVPLVAPIYGSIPCAQAQIQHFWTLDLIYTVSKKVTRQRTKPLSAVALL